MILDNHDMLPNTVATRLKSKKPINPQLTAPMMAIVSAKQSKNLLRIIISSFAIVCV